MKRCKRLTVTVNDDGTYGIESYMEGGKHGPLEIMGGAKTASAKDIDEALMKVEKYLAGRGDDEEPEDDEDMESEDEGKKKPKDGYGREKDYSKYFEEE